MYEPELAMEIPRFAEEPASDQPRARKRHRCDEARPVCGACSSRGELCSFPSNEFAPPSRGQNPQDGPGRQHLQPSLQPLTTNGTRVTNTPQLSPHSHLDMDNLKLIQYFHLHTAKQMTMHARRGQIWQRVIPDIALKSPYLTHLLLALGGIHMLTRRSKHDELDMVDMQIIMDHHQNGLRGFLEAVPHISTTNAEMIYTGSLLLVAFILASLQIHELNPPITSGASPFMDGMLQSQRPQVCHVLKFHWLHLIRGVSTVVHDQWPALKAGRLRQMVLYMHGDEYWKDLPFPSMPTFSRHPPRLQNFAHGCSQAITGLRAFLVEIQASTDGVPNHVVSTTSPLSTTPSDGNPDDLAETIDVLEAVYSRVISVLQCSATEQFSQNDSDLQIDFEEAAVLSWPVLIPSNFITSLEAMEEIDILQGYLLTILAHFYLIDTLVDFWMLSLVTLSSLIVLVLVIYAFGNVIYNLWFHPLRHYPGSKFDTATRLPYTFHVLRGTITQRTKRQHEKYGHVVRISPNVLSYTCSEAWNDDNISDIYGLRQSSMRGNLPKDPKYYLRGEKHGTNISNANDQDHRRLRRVQAHAFSEKALSLQEVYVQKYVGLFISRLGDEINSTRKGVINAVRWFNYLTTDIIGELAFGESFGGLEKNEMHVWLENLFWSLKTFAFFRELSRYPRGISDAIIAFMIPKSHLVHQRHAIEFGAEQAQKRLKRGTDRADFMSYILRHNDEHGMSDYEIAGSSITFIIAGSETTATVMSGLTYLLLKNPRTLHKATSIIRSDFPDSTAMTFIKLQKHEYINAVLSEALRLYPPAADSLFRVVPAGGGIVAGQFVPPDTSVTVNLLAAFRSPLNFKRPDEFIPERWLKNCPPEFESDKRCVFQPFSIGARNCLGKNLAWAEMRMILSNLLWHYNFEELMPDSINWIEKQKIYMLWEKPELNIRISKRR
ncbi:hypothetical protein PISL3812_04333 [Talaromyces islandicus]|uniref:Isotrichodermin C-15 hydroxylase n=1 Tax=Talaromyces islandicus TaxID=28573 RepID=A0A0U1LX04_TALIS|nr:hypothetical protein PISL3812_04333 [Talaromyces islandicus]